MLRRYAVTVAGRARAVEVEETGDGGVRVVVDGRERRLEVRRAGDGGAGSATYRWLDGSRVVNAVVDGAPSKATVTIAGIAMATEVSEGRGATIAAVERDRARAAGPITVRAPIPGRVAKVLAKVGERVAAGRALAVLEAMKMENEIRAPREATVREVRCGEGAAVDAGQALFLLE